MRLPELWRAAASPLTSTTDAEWIHSSPYAMKVPCRRRDANAGFSLTEILIALLILALGAGGVISLFVSASSLHRRAVDRTHAALVAEEVAETARLAFTPETKPNELIERVRARLPQVIDTYTYEIEATPLVGDGWGEGEVRLRVVVRREGSSDARAETFSTILLPRW